MASFWLNSRSSSDSRLRLFCLPYAGTGASRYFRWTSLLPATIEICPILLPGREGRIGEQPLTDMNTMLNALVRELEPERERPFALFGHSMGALIGFELARRLRQEFEVNPVRLFVSAHRAPHLPRSQPALHQLPDDQLRERLRQLQDGPEEMMQNDEYMQLMLPTLRADLQLCETYVHTSEPPLGCAISALGGIGDWRLSKSDLMAWDKHTSGAFTLRMFPGGHLFLNDCEADVTRSIVEDLS